MRQRKDPYDSWLPIVRFIGFIYSVTILRYLNAVLQRIKAAQKSSEAKITGVYIGHFRCKPEIEDTVSYSARMGGYSLAATTRQRNTRSAMCAGSEAASAESCTRAAARARISLLAGIGNQVIKRIPACSFVVDQFLA